MMRTRSAILAGRRLGPSTLWRMFGGWLLKDRRSGQDRRRRSEGEAATGRTMYGLPIIIDDSVPPGEAHFHSGRREVRAKIEPKEKE